MDAAAMTGMTTLVTRKITAVGVPIPEMIGGAIIGALVSLVLTYSPDLKGLLDPQSPVLYVTLTVAALIGAVLSFFLARKHVVQVNERTEPAERQRAA